jgi:hypothetical protein
MNHVIEPALAHLGGLISEYHPHYNSMRILRLDTVRADGMLQRH